MTNTTTDNANSSANEAAAPAFEQLPSSKSDEVIKRIGAVLFIVALKVFIRMLFR